MPFRGTPPCVGILGGGQLARMTALAGWPMGVNFLQLAPQAEVAGGIVETVTAPFDDEAALRAFAERVDVVTFESENVPVATAEFLGEFVPVRPGPRALAAAGNRWTEKDLFSELEIPTTRYVKVASADDLKGALEIVGLPAVAKMRRLGYDGRGQLVCRTADELLSAFDRLGGVPLLVEQWIPFDREVSIVGVRAADGTVRCYTPSENIHEQGILRASLAPAPDLAPALVETAGDYLRRIMAALDYVGVIALEMFQHGGALLANEIAPRVHNTGHWTIEGAVTSQFENHVRAIVGWPLGSTAHLGHSVMLNVIGDTPSHPEILAMDDVHVHAYGKSARPGRKLGHLTVLVGSPAEGRRRLDELRRIVSGA
ncbi:MAG TPA: 5-(carboxyamino)imidazole ribonucleotide synthase [Longimicrobiales bacterium]|nr:5-(carboxyamino)imidazole ribonucleotide synthase [Longimicrobiales bacterium]